MSTSLKNNRSHKKHRQEQQNNKFEDILNNLASLINKEVSTIADLNKKVAESQIKRDEAVTKLANTISNLFLQSGNTIQPEMHSSGLEPTLSYTTGTKYTRDELFSIIQAMRTERATFATIASYLKEKKIPTFSGNGDWHAQSIHRLCKEHNLDKKFTGVK